MSNVALLPRHVERRADLDALLRVATNYEERMPRALHERTFDLRRMEALLTARGRPERGPLTAHVAGSKGKGTLCRLLAAGLGAAYRSCGLGPVGLYISPHLVDLNERIVIDGQAVSDAELCAAGAALLPYVRETLDGPLSPTFFELMTAMAWEAFRARGVRAVVLETGLGGRLDATTVCTPRVTAITSIELEHTALLGSTLEAIAGEKAGILKPGVPCVTTATGVARDVIRHRAAELRAPLLCVGEDVVVQEAHTGPGNRLRVRARSTDGEVRDLTARLAGVHHAPALAAADAMLRLLGVAARAVPEGLAQATVPGVLEPVALDPLVLVDGAHTAGSARATREALAACWPGRAVVLLVGVLAEKDVRGVLEGLSRDVHAIVCTRAPSPRALEAAALFEQLPAGRQACVEPDLAAGLARARALCPPQGLVLASGSVYLAGAVKGLCEARVGATAPASPRPGSP